MNFDKVTVHVARLLTALALLFAIGCGEPLDRSQPSICRPCGTAI